MKTTKLVTMLVVAGLAMFFAACSESGTNVEETLIAEGDVKSSEMVEYFGDTCDFSAVLSEEEVVGLMEMREEEKLARDVYIYFYETYEYFVFNNISKSEDAHSRAVAYLIDGFGLADPALEGIGEFNDDLFTTLYASLTEQGSTSLADALKVGAFIEEYDIADLERLLETTENESIKRVYANLLRGSKFHLKAYTAALNRLGEAYEPTVISQDYYDEIIAGDDDTDDNTEDTDDTFVPGTGVCDGTGPNA
ncbi:DUF2202 domain-containing protein [uncultured Draconibacterium sp.]|uniref:DUF2202 domain-containing protein n=1 Tax=uncultured Draconibacterium sp. TaxID=1573823 RepID=UPI003217B2B1